MKTYNYNGLKFEIFDEHQKHSINATINERFMNNNYESEEIQAIRRLLNKDDIALDIGASLGVTSCVIADVLDNDTNLVCVEANPTLIDNITHNRNLNKLGFHIKEAVISHNNRTDSFNFNGLSHSGSIIKKTHLIGKEKEKMYGEYNTVQVTTLTPLDLEKEYNKKFTFLSCDVEGEEFDLLYEMFDYFKNFKSMVIEFHPHRTDSKHTRQQIHNMYSKYFEIETIGNTTVFKHR